MSLCGVLLTCAAAFAHPGHGVTDDQSVVHYVAEPVHSLPLILLGVACAAGWLVLRAIRRQR
jgi:hypothetical protein